MADTSRVVGFPERKPSGRPSHRPSDQELADKYVQFQTVKELAEFYGVSVSSVRVWLRKARERAAMA